jgi:glutathione S-transferase
LAGQEVIAADMMCIFSVQFIFKRNLCGGRRIQEWRNVERWVRECEESEGWKRAVGKTGHEM